MIEKRSIDPHEIQKDIWLHPDTLEPIDWTGPNEWAFLRGAFLVEDMSREEFEKRYPSVK